MYSHKEIYVDTKEKYAPTREICGSTWLNDHFTTLDCACAPTKLSCWITFFVRAHICRRFLYQSAIICHKICLCEWFFVGDCCKFAIILCSHKKTVLPQKLPDKMTHTRQICGLPQKKVLTKIIRKSTSTTKICGSTWLNDSYTSKNCWYYGKNTVICAV